MRLSLKSEEAKWPGRQGAATLSTDRRSVFARYLLAILLGNLVGEFAQLPLDTSWREGPWRQIAFAALHCTVGDLVIAALALLAAVALFGRRFWPGRRFGAVAATTVTLAVLYTASSEWFNTSVRGSWAYSAWMPKLPVIGTGLAPLAQWLVIPPLALLWARRGVDREVHVPGTRA